VGVKHVKVFGDSSASCPTSFEGVSMFRWCFK
jgi:hypothetical protein